MFPDSLSHINILAVIIAAIVNLIIGSFWYSPFMLGNDWMKEKGYTEEDFRKDGLPMRVILILSLTASLIAATAIAVFTGPAATALTGAITGFFISLCWITTSKANHLLFEHRSFKLFLIHAGYDICGYIVMGMIIGAWHK
jgi:hypothetical protein